MIRVVEVLLNQVQVQVLEVDLEVGQEVGQVVVAQMLLLIVKLLVVVHNQAVLVRVKV